MENDFKKRLLDLSDRAFRKNIACATAFLDPAELAAAHIITRADKQAKTLFVGGYPDAERKRLFFLPDYLEEEFFPYDEYISAIYAKCPFGSPTHRDWLGSLMGLGIKRETLGDILVCGDFAYIICTPQIAPFISENLTKIGRFGVKCEICSLSDIKAPEPEFDTVTGTVASLRADALTSLAFGISRTAAAELIRDGRLSLNHIEQTNPAAEISEGDLLSLRGYGRAKLSALGGTSKKGRQFITFYVFSKK